jgi:hypothetical protein
MSIGREGKSPGGRKTGGAKGRKGTARAAPEVKRAEKGHFQIHLTII